MNASELNEDESPAWNKFIIIRNFALKRMNDVIDSATRECNEVRDSAWEELQKELKEIREKRVDSK